MIDVKIKRKLTRTSFRRVDALLMRGTAI